MKKIYRTIQKYLNYFLIKVFSWFLKFFNYKVVPNLADLKKFNFDYSNNTRRLVFKNSENSFGKIIVDTSFFNSNFLGFECLKLKIFGILCAALPEILIILIAAIF